jgi:DNA-directed RNA polymerase subunit RPC12/RpoP
MEPLVRTMCCPNCSEALLSFLEAPETECEACGFKAEVFADRKVAMARFRAYASDGDVIVTDPVPLGRTRWVIAHTRLLLV